VLFAVAEILVITFRFRSIEIRCCMVFSLHLTNHHSTPRLRLLYFVHYISGTLLSISVHWSEFMKTDHYHYSSSLPCTDLAVMLCVNYAKFVDEWTAKVRHSLFCVP